MRFLFVGLALAAALSAKTIDVSSQTTQELQSGDSLVFLFADTSYAQRASSMGMASSPLQIFFNLISAPIASAGQFTAALKSMDGSDSAPFPGSLTWSNGVVQTSGYSGQASVLSDSLTLSSALSREIFAGSEAELALTYTGPDITVGLPGHSLQHDLTVSLAGGPLSIGAVNSAVSLVRRVPVVATPEPGTAALVFAAGLLMCAVSLALKRFARSSD
jgi:hypothetical protein